MHAPQHPAQHHIGFPEVHLSIAGRMKERHKHLLLALLLSAHIIAHDGGATHITVFLLQPLEDALGGVALLGRARLVLQQHLVDQTPIRIQARTSYGLLAVVAGWHRKLQHLGYGGAGQAKATRGFALADPFHTHSTTNTRIHLHGEHPFGLTEIEKRNRGLLLLRY